MQVEKVIVSAIILMPKRAIFRSKLKAYPDSSKHEQKHSKRAKVRYMLWMLVNHSCCYLIYKNFVPSVTDSNLSTAAVTTHLFVKSC